MSASMISIHADQQTQLIKLSCKQVATQAPDLDKETTTEKNEVAKTVWSAEK
jgi:hypothetical protein